MSKHQPKPPTLTQQLRALPRHVWVDFRQHGTAWYAQWEIRGVPYARRLGADQGGQIAREIARRQHLAQYTPEEPLPKYSRVEQEEPTCEHPHPVIWCDVCRERMRTVRRERTA